MYRSNAAVEKVKTLMWPLSDAEKVRTGDLPLAVEVGCFTGVGEEDRVCTICA